MTKVISLDTEAPGLDIYHSLLPFIVTIGQSDGGQIWWEWDVDPYTRRPSIPTEDLVEIQGYIDDADTILLHNPVFDSIVLRKAFEHKGLTLEWEWSKVIDTLLAAHLVNSLEAHTLTYTALMYAGIDIDPYDKAVKEACKQSRAWAKSNQPEWRIATKELPEMPSAKGAKFSIAKSDMWLPKCICDYESYDADHPWQTVTIDYARTDTDVLHPIWEAQREILEGQGLLGIYQERLKLLPIIESMSLSGVGVNTNRLHSLRDKYLEKSERYHKACISVAEDMGHELILPKSGNNNSLLDFAEAEDGLDLLSQKSVVVGKAGRVSLKSSAMETFEFEIDDPSKKLFLSSLRKKRKVDTFASYIDGYLRFKLPVEGLGDEWGLLHPGLNPTGSDTLRTSSSNPNAQNVSAQPDDDGLTLRFGFGPLPGREWWALDYDNIELRIPAYESGEKVMIEIFEKPTEPPYFGSYHLMNASIIYPDKFWPLAEEEGAFKEKYKKTYYQWAKNFGFAVSYGAMESSGTADRAAHKKGAQKMVMDRLKEHSKLNQWCIDFAQQNGYVETLPDIEVNPDRGYPLYCEMSRWGKVRPTVPLNYRVQGTACWVVMRAMIEVHEYLSSVSSENGETYRIALNVHDEIVLDFPKRLGKGNLPIVMKVKEIMESLGDCLVPQVPLTCGVEYHRANWGEGETVV